MDFMGIGAGEIILILVVVLVIFGPGKLISIARSLGKLAYTIRKTASEMSSQVSKELENDKPPFSETKKDQP